MQNKQQALAALREELGRWEELLAGLSEEQITDERLPEGRSIKDDIGHLRAWQQVSIARLEAALANAEPVMPGWLAGRDPDAEEDTELFNTTIYMSNRDRPWASVYQEWRGGFVRLLELAEQIPEGDLLDTAKYPWLKGYALMAVLEGSYEHHHTDHLEPLLAQLGRKP